MKQFVKITIITYANIEAHTYPVNMHLVRVNSLTIWPTISSNVYLALLYLPIRRYFYSLSINQFVSFNFYHQ